MSVTKLRVPVPLLKYRAEMLQCPPFLKMGGLVGP